jgi:hypothetical protein
LFSFFKINFKPITEQKSISFCFSVCFNQKISLLNTKMPSSDSTPVANNGVTSCPHATNGTSTASVSTSSRWPENVGILGIQMYFPNQFVDQTELEEHDGASKGKLNE